MSTVLITGVSRYVGGRVAAALSADPSIERIVGLDTVAPRPEDEARLGRTEFVRADIRNPLIAKVIAHAGVDTVVHAAVLAAPRTLGRTSMKETNVIGTMQLLAACQKAETVRRLVVKSTTAVYGAGPRDPGLFTEQMTARRGNQAGYAQDAVEVEGYVRGFARRRPDVDVSILRIASVVGPEIDSPLARYLAVPVVPTPLGFDARLQLLHEVDAVEVLRRAAVGAPSGTFNVAADGVVTLTQALRLANRLRLPVPGLALAAVSTIVGNVGLTEFSAEQHGYLYYGRVVDTTRLKQVFGYQPRYTTREAIEAHFAAHPSLPAPGVLRRAEGLVSSVLAPRVGA